jgi:hypothetical protein
MLKSIRKPLTICLLTLLAITVLVLSGCESALIDNGMHRNECELYVNALLNEDFEAAHAVTPALSKEEHRPYFEQFCKSFEGATSYELTQTGWKINTINGTTVKIAAYQIELDNGTTCQLTLQTTEGHEGISYINFNDSTKFIESTKDVKNINIVLIVVSIVLMAFPLWMLIDCIKRKMLKKVWWIICILLSLSLTFTSGAGTSNFSFMLTLLFQPWAIKAIIPNETVSLTVVLPLGALIYFFRRKKLSKTYQERVDMESLGALADTMELTLAAIDQMEPAAPPSASDYPKAAESAGESSPTDPAIQEDSQTSEQQ